MELEIKSFSDINISDSFFDNLRSFYPEFDEWYRRKASEGAKAFVFFDGSGKVTDFLYLKVETEALNDLVPSLPAKRRLKIGTFKILPRHTRRGERFMKKIVDRAIAEDVDEVYVTVFPLEELKFLIRLFDTFGFKHVADKPHHGAMNEWVMVKDMRHLIGDSIKDYPFVKLSHVNKFLLSVHPVYHTKLFPDSILQNESYDTVQDIKATNSIFKTYICWMRDASLLNEGDIVVIYRTNDGQGSAYFRSVVTSICTIRRVLRYKDYYNVDDFLKNMEYSVFTEVELKNWYKYKSNFTVIEMLYNVAFTKKLIRKVLIEQAGIPGDAYWGVFKLSDEQYKTIIRLGEADERYFVD